jgi:ankyrin repeat protein
LAGKGPLSKPLTPEEQQSLVNSFDLANSTPLHYAVYKNHKGTVMYLLDKEAHVNLADDLGFTPLHIGAYEGYSDIVLLLLDQPGIFFYF